MTAHEDEFDHTQTILATPELQAQGIYGNCVQAALATVLQRPLEAVPHVGQFSLWQHAMRLWLRGDDLDFTLVEGPTIPQERAMLVGLSPRGYMHAVVSERGQIVWDPHPSRDGLTTVTGAYVIHEWVPAGDDATVADVVHAVEVLLDDSDQFTDNLRKPNRVAIWGVRRVLMRFGGKPHRWPMPAEHCAECQHATADHGLGSVDDDLEQCRADDCDCLLSNNEAAWGRDESIDNAISQVTWEDAVTNGESWATPDVVTPPADPKEASDD